MFGADIRRLACGRLATAFPNTHSPEHEVETIETQCKLIGTSADFQIPQDITLFAKSRVHIATFWAIFTDHQFDLARWASNAV
jgi:hypothetical protein